MMWLPRVTEADLESEEVFAGWPQGLERQLQIVNGSGPRYRVRTASAEGDEDDADMVLVVEREHHGTKTERVIHGGFFLSPEYELIAATGAEFKDLIEPGAYVTRGRQRVEISRFPDAIEWLMDQAKQSQSIQRYKGLGEMNPQQLWDTTVNPENPAPDPGAHRRRCYSRRDLQHVDGRSRRAPAGLHRTQRSGGRQSGYLVLYPTDTPLSVG